MDKCRNHRQLYAIASDGLCAFFETYKENRLVGGLYGVSLGAMFSGESMFHLETDASKVAFYYLIQFA